MAPAQRLVENQLAEQFGVARAGIRAALIDLEAQGLVERIRNRGSRVRAVSVDEAVAVTECRMVLEGLCAAKAAVAAGDEQLTQLADLGAAMTKAVTDGEPLTYSAQPGTARQDPGVLRPADGRGTAGAAWAASAPSSPWPGGQLLAANKGDWGFTAFALAGLSSMVFIGVAALRGSKRAPRTDGRHELIGAH